MYAPLQYMYQVGSMITIPQNKPATVMANMKNALYVRNRLKSNREQFVYDITNLWNKFAHNEYDEADLNLFLIYRNSYQRFTGLQVVETAEDFYGALSQTVIREEWSMRKTAYKIEKSLLEDFKVMKMPDTVPNTVFTHLPSGCFYMEFDGTGPTEDFVGLFCTSAVCRDRFICRLTSLVNHGRLIPIYTDLQFPIDEVSEVSTRVDMFREETMCDLEDGTTIRFKERELARIFFNFCIYLSSSNRDVEYTERTRAAYRPTNNPKNKIREVEEFGVGYRYAASISAKKVRVKYVGNTHECKEKRVYSSNYRSAHWHAYWVNDEDNPGNKKKVIKWVAETFVHGNREGDSKVRVHRVVKKEE